MLWSRGTWAMTFVFRIHSFGPAHACGNIKSSPAKNADVAEPAMKSYVRVRVVNQPGLQPKNHDQSVRRYGSTRSVGSLQIRENGMNAIQQ